MTEENLKRSVSRAKKRIRHSCLQIQADHMLTLTTRAPLDRDQFSEHLQTFLKRFRKRYSKRHYVVVMEEHKDGSYHAHMAIRGFMDYNSIRILWHWTLSGGKYLHRGEQSPGNIQGKKPLRGHDWHPGRLSRYITKYISKDFEGGDINKKRYWVSKNIAEPDSRTFFMPYGPGTIRALSTMLQNITGDRPRMLREFELGQIRGVYIATY